MRNFIQIRIALMVKLITPFENLVLHPAIHTIKIALFLTLAVLCVLPVYATESLLTDMEAKALMLHKQGQYSEAVTYR